MQSSATTVDAYVRSLPADRRDAIAKVRATVNRSLPRGFEERMQFGMISWVVPEAVLPAREVYNKQPLAIASLASQKNYLALYLLAIYGDAKLRASFVKAYKASGKKLDMGQSCLRFKTVDALPLDVIGEALSHTEVAAFVAAYKQLRAGAKARPRRAVADKLPASKQATGNRPTSKTRTQATSKAGTQTTNKRRK
jgi:hypothetical protein